MPRLVWVYCCVTLLAAGMACNRADGTPGRDSAAEASYAAPDKPSVLSSIVNSSSANRDALPERTELVTGRDCEEVVDADREIAEQVNATIPAVVGLTFGYIWVGPDTGKNDFDHECLTQVTAVDARRIVYKSRCSGTRDSSRVQYRTQLCRADLRDGSIYRTEFGVRIPDLVAGSTQTVLSRRSFRELKSRGETPFRQVHVVASMWQTGAEAPDPDATVYLTEDVSGTLRKTGAGTVAVQVNDSLMMLPVIRSEVVLKDAKGHLADQHERLDVLDDERFPVVLDNQRTTAGAGIRFIRVTWPTTSAIERDLAQDRESVVYGIYFDYNSAEIRAESEVVLQEIARALETHADWSLSIVGHTDSIGGPSFNQTLSAKRADAVRTALVDRYKVAESRLTSAGAGASRPVDTNDTPEGRSRNRRVELRRP